MSNDEPVNDSAPVEGPLSRSEIVEVMRLWQEAEQSAQNSRRQVLAVLGRGIRGPVSHISGMAGLLMDSQLNGEQRESVHAIQAAAENLLKLVEQIQGVGPATTGPQTSDDAAATAAQAMAAGSPRAEPMQANPYAGVNHLALPSHRVLVADDDPTSRTLAARMLQRIGYESDVVEDGLQAVQAVQDHSYCAVLMDCQMPRMDGYQATRAIRQLTGRVGEVPVIALTANAMEGDDMACLVAGMDDYLAKPVNPKKLAEVLSKWAKSA